MYANMRVKIGNYEAIRAHLVRIEGGELIVHEDLSDGEGRAVPGAVHRAALDELPREGVAIKADF